MITFDDELMQADDLAVLSAYVDAEEAAKQDKAEAPSADDLEEASPLNTEAETGQAESADEGERAAQAKTERQIWVCRLRDVDGIPGERMAPIHGRLIAHGLLKFQLRGQTEGIVYHVTGAGRRQLAAQARSTAEDSIANVDSASTHDREAA